MKLHWFVAMSLAVSTVAAADQDAQRTVDVIVTDSRGARVAGLTGADFTLLENGKPKEIKRVVEITPETGAEIRRRIVILFDSSALSLQSRKKAVVALRAAASTLVRPQDRVAVATITPTGGILEAVRWTNDLASVTSAFDLVESEVLASASVASDGAEQEIQQLIKDDESASSDSHLTFESLMVPARQYAEFVSMQTRNALAGISDAVDYCGDGPGKKAVVIIGGGLPSQPGAGLFQFLETIRAQAMAGLVGNGIRRGAGSSSPLAEVSRYNLALNIRKVSIAAFSRGVVIYTIDPEGWRSDSTVNRTEVRDMAADGASALEKRAGYQLLTKGTGGVSLFGGSAAEAVAQITADLQAHYALTIEQTSAGNDAPRIEVRTKPGYHARLWFEGGAATKESLMEDAVIGNHRGDVASNDLQIALASDPPVSEGLDRRVKVKVFIPVKSLTLTRDGGDYIGGFDVYVSTGDATGNASAVHRQKYQIRWPAAQIEQMREKTIAYAVDVVLIPGRTQVSIGVVDQESQHTGFARAIIGG